jgi:signal transduction histidine kinase
VAGDGRLGIIAAVVQVGTLQLAYLAALAYAVLFFTLGVHDDRRVRLFGLAAGLIGSVVGGAAAVLDRQLRAEPSAGSALALALVVTTAMAGIVCVGGWVAGYLRWQARQAVEARVEAQLEAAERRRLTELYELEQERRRIAADMHDVVAHSWAVVAAQADGGRYALAHDPSRTDAALVVIGDAARTAISDLRTLVAQLREPGQALPEAGPARQAELLDRMRASGMALEFTEQGSPAGSPLLATTANRLLSESLTNALKHGDLTKPVVVEQDWRGGYRLQVRNSVGERSELGSGQGIAGLLERAAVAGGAATSQRDADTWVVCVTIPGVGS